MSRKREKPYSSKFKESSVKLALESKDPITHTANNLGIKTSTLHTWISKYTKPKEPNVRTDEHIYDEVKKGTCQSNRGERPFKKGYGEFKWSEQHFII